MLPPEAELRLNGLRDSLPGRTLPGSDGRSYPLGPCLGEGGQGWIFRGSWNGSIDVVVKVLRPDVLNQESLARFEREATILRTMSQQPAPNPHVVRYYDHAFATLLVPGTSESWTLPFTVLEYVDGDTLTDTLGRERRGLGVARARRLLRHVVLALRDVHAQNIIHRDLKPSNILVDRSGGRELAKVTDFGLAKVFTADLHRTKALAGATVGYAPPEQFERGNPRVCKATDVFSLAAIFFEMLTGKPAFPIEEGMNTFVALHKLLQGARPTFAQTPQLPREVEARPDVVAGLDRMLARALAADPKDRYQTVTELYDAVDAAFGGPAEGQGSDLPPRHGEPRRASAPPRSTDPESQGIALAATIPIQQVSRDTFRSSPPSAIAWRVLLGPGTHRPLASIAVSGDGAEAAAVGPDGLRYWNGVAWSQVDLRLGIAPLGVCAVAWLGRHLVLAGPSPMVWLRAPDGIVTAHAFGAAGLAFHGAYADEQGVVLAGERGGAGIVAMMNLERGATLSLAWVPVQGVGPLRAAIRLGRVVMACGDHGIVARVLGGRADATQLCESRLQAILAAPEGGAIVAGAGGYVFRVKPTLEARLEAVQTQRSIHALARGPGGGLYAGGEERRVLVAAPEGWVRTGAQVALPRATVRALYADARRVRAFCDDGSILEAPVAGI